MKKNPPFVLVSRSCSTTWTRQAPRTTPVWSTSATARSRPSSTRASAFLRESDRRVGFPSVDFEVDFIKPIRHGDVIHIGVRVAHLGRTSVGLAFEARRGRTFSSGGCAAAAGLSHGRAPASKARMRARFLALT